MAKSRTTKFRQMHGIRQWGFDAYPDTFKHLDEIAKKHGGRQKAVIKAFELLEAQEARHLIDEPA